MISSANTSGAVVTLYDGTSTGGTIIHQMVIVFPGGGNMVPISMDFKGMPFANGLFLAVTVQAANVTVMYE